MSYINGKKIVQIVRTTPVAVDIEANPSGEATEVLEKLKVDDTIYSIDGGASSPDSAMSDSSVNAVQNKVIKQYVDNEIDKIEDGKTVVGKAQTAQALDNVSENSGSTQEDPFIAQGTGTNNNTSETPTSPKAHQLEKQGNIVVVNQQAKEINNTNYSFSSATGTFNSGIVTFLASAQYGECLQYINVIAGHQYLIGANIKLTTATTDITLNLYGLDKSVATLATTNWQNLVIIGEQTLTGNYALRVIDNRDSNWDNIQAKDIICIDLTQWFGSTDNIPADLLAHPETFINYYNGSLAYNEGSPETSNGRYLITIGFNQWDEEWEVGSISLSTGQNTSANNRIRSKNFIRVIPNTTYYYKSPYGDYILFYDIDKNYLGNYINITNTSFTTPNNCGYIKFYTSASYGETYNYDICINLSWDTERNGEYKGFVKHVYNTGTMAKPYSAGNLRNIKKASGEEIDYIDKYTFTGNETCTYNSEYDYFEVTVPISAKVYSANVLCAGYLPIENIENDLWTQIGESSNLIRFANHSFSGNTTTFMASLVGKEYYYELDTPITETGTSFDEIIDVDDYGTMYWLDDNEDFVEVPQGCKLFYPADYALLIDDLGNYTNYDVTTLAKKSDLTDYVKQVDLSSSISGLASLTIQVKNAYKIGNVLFITIRAKNETGSTITANAGLFSISNINTSYAQSFSCVVYNNGTNTIEKLGIDTVGKITIDKALANGDFVFINISYAIA